MHIKIQLQKQNDDTKSPGNGSNSHIYIYTFDGNINIICAYRLQNDGLYHVRSSTIIELDNRPTILARGDLNSKSECGDAMISTETI